MATITTIVSGGQTGADRAALDLALARGISIRGWVPRGRMAEDGPIADRYPNLQETDGEEPAERTRLNVRDADASLIISHGPLAGGSLLALETAVALGKPVLHVDLTRTPMAAALEEVTLWVREHEVTTLGVGGPRASEDPHVYRATLELLDGVLERTLGSDG